MKRSTTLALIGTALLLDYAGIDRHGAAAQRL
jgi:hypothetical protein